MEKTGSIPQPPGWPILGNLLNLDFELPLRSLCNLADEYGGLYRLRLPGQNILIASSYDLVNELCDEKRFPKSLQGFKEMRYGIRDGLLTAYTEESNWGIAHRVLVPAFAPVNNSVWFDGMYDIASQMALKWARHGRDSPIALTEDLTRLTLDTIALCSMDFRFNSFYKDDLHPFIQSMCNFLLEAGNRQSRPPIPSIFYRNKDSTFFSDIKVLQKTASQVLQQRKAEGSLDMRKDLLSAMLIGTDPKTGQRMSDDSIMDNLITFLIAGHETTSGLLSFALYHLITNPEAYEKARAEVDQVCGQRPLKFEHISKLSYIPAVLRESLRLNPTIPVFNVAATKDEVIGGGRYHIPANELILLLLTRSHSDPQVFGDDASEFKPERMLDEEFDRLNQAFPNCWRPFGNGTRACIGRPFAWQEATLVLTVLLQNFHFTLDDPTYRLALKQTLTVKPDGLKIRAELRDGLTATQLERKLAGTPPSAPNAKSADGRNGSVLGMLNGEENLGSAAMMSIYYGSNSGTCKSMAENLAANAFSRGFRARVVDIADNAIHKLVPGEPIIIITASYEGQAPDNAAKLVDWLENGTCGDLSQVSYAVFGCGNREWTNTFHRIPKLVDAAMEKHGAARIALLGLSDVSTGTMFTDFETWNDDVLWPAMTERYSVTKLQGPSLTVKVSSERKHILHYHDLCAASVIDTSTLTDDDALIVKKYMKVQLPPSSSFRAGDYLDILPANPKDVVYRVMRHFHLPWDAQLSISASAETRLPANVSTPALDIFGSYVELSRPATKRNILTLADYAQDAKAKLELQSLCADDHYASHVVAKHVSVLDLLQRGYAPDFPLDEFLRMLPSMCTRQYSISSSPLTEPDSVVLTYSVLEEAKNGRVGVATSYLSSLAKGDTVHVTVRPSHHTFHLPESNRTDTAIIMVAAGTGISPFRGFIQERAALQLVGTTNSSSVPALLFFGCRDPNHDDLYRPDLDKWEATGAVTSIYRAYSRNPEASEGCKYVQDRLWKEREQVMDLWAREAKMYICGGMEMGKEVKKMFIDMLVDRAKKRGENASLVTVGEMFESSKNIRWAMDVFN